MANLFPDLLMNYLIKKKGNHMRFVLNGCDISFLVEAGEKYE